MNSLIQQKSDLVSMRIGMTQYRKPYPSTVTSQSIIPYVTVAVTGELEGDTKIIYFQVPRLVHS